VLSSVDVGDAVELTFNTVTGATVLASWYDPDGNVVIDQASVAENPAGSGQFPKTFLPTSPGIWYALFTASGAATAVERYFIRANSITGPVPLATVDDFAEVFGTLTTAQQGLVAALLRHASRMLRAAFPDLDSRITSGDLDPDQAALAVIQMVQRVMRNPGGIRSETVGPFSRTFDTSAAAGLLSITAAETALIAALTTTPPASTIWAKPGLAPPPLGRRRHPRWWGF
jgi:hypothetical protein